MLTPRLTLLAGAAFLSLIGAASAEICDTAQLRIRFGLDVTENHPVGESALALQDRVNDAMGPHVCMEVYLDGSLGDGRDLTRMALVGQIELFAAPLRTMEPYSPAFQVFDLPFLLRDAEAVDRVLASTAGEALLDALADEGIRLLAIWQAGFKVLSAHRALLGPADASGLRIRISGGAAARAHFEAVEAIPDSLAFSELYAALQNGVVDGQEGTWFAFEGARLYEVQSVVTETKHAIAGYVIGASEAWWRSLPDDVRYEFSDIFAQVTAAHNAGVEARELAIKDALQGRGIEIHMLTRAERDAWTSAAQPVWDAFENEFDVRLLEAAQAIEQP